MWILTAVEARNFGGIREWDGSQDRAFEELCYQLRDPTPSGAELKKTGDPDAGYEWYFRLANGVEWGWQAKNSTDIDDVLKLMERSLRTVCEKRPACRKLTFCIPFDLPDGIEGRQRKSARKKFEDRKVAWRNRIEGAERVKVELIDAGGLLERLTGHPNQRGIELFFWDRECFSEAWCRERLRSTIDIAGRRYSPELHVDLPVAFSLDGLAGSERFWERYATMRRSTADEARRMQQARFPGLGVTDRLTELRRSLREWPEQVQAGPQLAGGLDPGPALAATRRAIDAADRVRESLSKVEGRSSKADRLRARGSKLERELNRLSNALESFRALLDSDAARARETNSLLLRGDAGQGKTHLFCDAGQRLLDQGHPTLVMLGSRFRDSGPWRDIAEQVGLEDIGSEALLGAMKAAGEAAERPFVLLIDALNEAGDPHMWLEELPAMLSVIAASPWVSIGLSYRSSFEEVIVREEGVGACPVAEHRGFAGRESVATDGFFDHFGLATPRVPLLMPEFLNPLFLKLYCEGAAATDGWSDGEHAHISEVFDGFLKVKEAAVCRQLKLDRRSQPLQEALALLAAEMIERRSDHVGYPWATDALGRLAPSRNEWPDTLLGALLSEGVLTRDLVWSRERERREEVVRLTYQRLSDYRVADVLLADKGDVGSLEASLAPDLSLGATITLAPAGWVEALSVRVPELFGVELLDLADWRLDGFTGPRWDRAFIQSVASRRADAVSATTMERLDAMADAEPELAENALEARLLVAANPSHPLNARDLHEHLMKLSLPDRDTSWSLKTYFAFDDEGPLKRILRWAARGPHLECDEDVVELALLAMAWTLTSPHRRLRDHTTKLMTLMLAPRLVAARRLLEDFQGVNDPYVLERLAAISHGAILNGGRSRPHEAFELAEALRHIVLDNERIPNLVARDSVRGSYEWCVREGLVGADQLPAVSPPYDSAAPEEPRSERELKEDYGERKSDEDGSSIRNGYAAIYFSLFSMGDFGRYVVGSRVHNFSEHPLQEPFPERPDESHENLEKLWERITAGLDEDQIEKLKTRPLEIGDVIGAEPLGSLKDAIDPRPRRRSEYPGDKAACWIFERVLELGWTPERFDDWEMTFVRPRDRSAHKIERFGKKYQWIALSELIARISDNFHMSRPFGEGPDDYRGPWQFFGRDIDPTLPPAPIAPEVSREHFDETFPMEEGDVWWKPPGPVFAADDPPVADDWASRTSDVPDFESLVRREDDEGKIWVALHAYLNWDEEEDGAGDVIAPRRRDLWSHLKTWLVRREDRAANVVYLKDKSFMNHWMPQGGEVTDAAYLAEMPWSSSSNRYPNEWTQLDGPSGETAPDGLELYPAWLEYMWEGSVNDCSIDEGVRSVVPAPLLFERGGLSWRPGTTEWMTQEGTVVAGHRRSGSHSNLLVDESWLTAVLTESGWSLIVGLLGEKQLFSGGRFSPELVGSWTEMNGVAVLDEGHWTFHGPRFDERTPAR